VIDAQDYVIFEVSWIYCFPLSVSFTGQIQASRSGCRKEKEQFRLEQNGQGAKQEAGEPW